MRRFKKNTGKNLYQLNKVRFEAQAYNLPSNNDGKKKQAHA